MLDVLKEDELAIDFNNTSNSASDILFGVFTKDGVVTGIQRGMEV